MFVILGLSLINTVNIYPIFKAKQNSNSKAYVMDYEELMLNPFGSWGGALSTSLHRKRDTAVLYIIPCFEYSENSAADVDSLWVNCKGNNWRLRELTWFGYSWCDWARIQTWGPVCGFLSIRIHQPSWSILNQSLSWVWYLNANHFLESGDIRNAIRQREHFGNTSHMWPQQKW